MSLPVILSLRYFLLWRRMGTHFFIVEILQCSIFKLIILTFLKNCLCIGENFFLRWWFLWDSISNINLILSGCFYLDHIMLLFYILAYKWFLVIIIYFIIFNVIAFTLLLFLVFSLLFFHLFIFTLRNNTSFQRFFIFIHITWLNPTNLLS